MLGGVALVGMSAITDRVDEEPVDAEVEVMPLELFFDLIFVFSITQVTGFVSAGASWTRLVEGLAILAVLWFAWEGVRVAGEHRGLGRGRGPRRPPVGHGGAAGGLARGPGSVR
jgi:hypothetical protein